MVPFKYTPPNHLFLTEKVLRSFIDSSLEFEFHKYGRRDKCNCTVFHVNIKTAVENELKLNQYLTHQFIDNIETNKVDNAINSSFEIRYKKIRRDFHKIYESVFPNYSNYIDVNKYPNGDISILLYRKQDTKHIQFTVVTDNTCSFSKENATEIEQALLISRKGKFWEIRGTGCACSNFEPLDIEILDKNSLSFLFRKLQSELDSEGNFQGEISGSYDA